MPRRIMATLKVANIALRPRMRLNRYINEWTKLVYTYCIDAVGRINKKKLLYISLTPTLRRMEVCRARNSAARRC